MLRSPIAASSDHVLVAPGELKVSCGREVVFETTPLHDAFAVAVFDPVSSVGGVCSIALDGGGQRERRDLDLAVPKLIDSVLRMGGERGRLVCATAGDSRSFANRQEASREKPGAPVRRECIPGTVVLQLDLGAGRVTIANATH